MTKRIDVDLKEFFLTGKFNCIELGQSEDWIIKNFVEPDEKYTDKMSNVTSWIYGSTEFFFKENNLFTIYSDGWFDFFTDAKNIQYKKWILEDISKLTLKYVLTVLNTEKVNYKVKFDKNLENVTVYIEKSNVELLFEEIYRSDVIDNAPTPNDYKIVAFGLKI